MQVGLLPHVEEAAAVEEVTQQGVRSRRSDTAFMSRAVAVAFAVLVGLVGLTSCGSSGPGGTAETVSLAQLSEHQQDLAGQRVSTTGTVRRFGHGAGVHYVLEDPAHNRVEVAPASSVADRVGSEVTVTGEFGFDESTGRRIEVDSVHPAT